MKKIIKTDERGYKRIYLLRDGDPEEDYEMGIPLIPPDLSEVDWEAVKRDMHNQLVDRGLFSWADVQAQQNSISAAARSVLARHVVALYRLNHQEATDE